MQYVFKSVAESLDALLGAVQTAMGSSGYKLRELSTDSDTFIPTDDSLQHAIQSMRQGKLATIAVHPESGPIRYALISSPLTCGRSLSQYLGTIEYTERDFRPLWNMLLSVRGLSLVCLGFEEGVDISDEILKHALFPWNAWPLVIGAIKHLPSDTKWIIGEGPEMASVPLPLESGTHNG
jgi:hypothetical protein